MTILSNLPRCVCCVILCACAAHLRAPQAAPPVAGAAQSTPHMLGIYYVAELTTEQIRRLDRAKTVVLLPGGICEEHGPYLPSWTDGYWNEKMTRQLAERIAFRPGWNALLFPTIPLGNSPANEIAGLFSFPGSYPVRMSTLRAFYMDLGTELGEQGFRWIFVVSMHGGPNHSRALDQASEYFRDTYGGHMVHLLGLMSTVWETNEPELPAEQQEEEGLPIHAGVGETSEMLFIRPDLVDQGYKTARPYASSNMEGIVKISRQPGWPGYFGSPRLSTVRHGESLWNREASRTIDLAMKILDGLDERTIERYQDVMAKSAADLKLDEASLKHEEEMTRKQEQWLKKRLPRAAVFKTGEGQVQR